jgi:RimJ/RimL family protein N-acetyltransferase
MEVSITDGRVVLRDRRPSDNEDKVRWLVHDTWWADWDAPWEKTVRTEEEVRERQRTLFPLEFPAVRGGFEVDTCAGIHLGWTNAYKIGGDPARRAIGIILPDLARGGPGLGTAAYALHAAYRFRVEGRTNIYAETWSGNLPMVGLARRCGFEVYERTPGEVEVRGRAYDGLTFVLAREAFFRRFPELESVPMPA